MSAEIIQEYYNKVLNVHKTGVATEHSYRPALEWLFDKIEVGITAINEPKGVKVGRPDFVFQRGIDQITVGHCEAKDINLDITPKSMDKANKAQFNRYVKGLPNLIYTNCLDFHFYKNGKLVRKISIGDYLPSLPAKEDQFEALSNQLKDFAAEKLQTITSSEALAKMMAGKASIIKDVLFNTLKEDEELKTELAGQFKAFKDQLIHDLTIEDFADIYSETIAYGMFGARLHDETLEDFTREEALELLPKSNPFLRRLFEYVAGPNLEDGLRRTVDELAEIFQATDLQKLFENFGAFTQRNDPFIHFYETFLAAYNPKKKKARGVWYTPEPVVNFIVRAVDDVLKSEFDLPLGLADTSKISIDWDTGDNVLARRTKAGKKVTVSEPLIEKRNVHRVQILDPATGTGTFLAEVIKQISPRIQGIARGQWPKYVENELIPRLHGFELLMASYAMCHMKLDMTLSEMGYIPTNTEPRFNVYLTNSLEAGASEPKDLFMAKWLSQEANLANDVKNKSPIMCVIGNPPYLGEAGKPVGWIGNLMDDYKREPDSKQKLQERNSKWINDLYVQFIRMSSHMIEKNGEGVLAFITNHSYLDNPTFRGMRWHLTNTFDKIFILDLHGNSKKKEVCPDGSPDKNVFDIQQGVAIIIAVKKKTKPSTKKSFAKIMHGDLWGSRKEKNTALELGSVHNLIKDVLPNHPPQFPFVKRDFSLEKEYLKGFGIQELMPLYSVGIVTGNDAMTTDEHKDSIWERVEDFTKLSAEEVREKFNIGGDVEKIKHDVVDNYLKDNLVQIAYRPFDKRWTFYTGRSNGFLCRPRNNVMSHLLKDNLSLSISRQQKASTGFYHVLAHENIMESSFTSNKTAEIGSAFPLYFIDKIDQSRRVNMDSKIRKAIEKTATGKDAKEPNEVDIFDYIYGVLHCSTYREFYREFLKIDFPRIPYPTSPESFWNIASKGYQLRHLHLMEVNAIGETPYPFDGEGDSIVEKPMYKEGVVFINETQFFDNVSMTAWEFQIGGYKPAQKWLKDRIGRELSFEDILHYQKIIKILSETDRIMKIIDMPLN